MRAWMIGLAAIAAPIAIMGGAAMAADEGSKPLTLERLFASPDLAGPQPRAMKLSPDGKLVTLLKNRPDERDRYDLWALDTATGAERMLVDSKRIGSGADLTEAEKMQRERQRIAGQKGIVAYDWAPDGKSILVPLDGDLYLATLDGRVSRLTHGLVGGALNPVISPGGSQFSFVNGQNLFVAPLRGCTSTRGDQGAAEVCPGVRKITTDGAGTVHWGEAEFVAQEEMNRDTGYWWSPNDRLVAVERFDEAPVGVVTRAAIGADGTKVYDQRYPAAGTPNVRVELWVIDPASGAKVKVDLGSDPDIYLARVDWTPDGKTLLVQRENRAQTQLDMLAVDPATGKAKTWFSEKSGPKSWVNLTDDYRALDDGSLIWKSERDGYGHLYRFAKGKWMQLTKGPWVVTELVGVDRARGRLYFLGNKDDVLEQQLYSVDIAKPNVITRLTERGWWNKAVMDDAATRLIVTRSNPNQPAQSYLADPAGKRIAWVNENAVKAGHPYFPYLADHKQRTFGTIKAADGTILHYEMITPTLEPGKRYPVFFQHYGGPHSQTVSRAWESPMEQYIVDRGYIFFQIDNRGSANRGTTFEDSIYRAMGGVEVADQLAGANWLKAQSYVDPDRIGIYGWSYGGYMTLKMLQANPAVYAAGVAGAPVTKWELYDTSYTERYMGIDPKGADAKAYATANAMDDAAKISDPLMLIHGMSDDNVVFENSTAFAAKMQAGNRPFEMMFYPGKTHAAGKDIHVWTTIFDFFDRTVKNRK